MTEPIVLATLLASIIAIFFKEILNSLPYISRLLIKYRAKWIDEEVREKIVERIFDDLDTMDSNIGKLIIAFGFIILDWPKNVPNINDVDCVPQKLTKDEEEEAD